MDQSGIIIMAYNFKFKILHTGLASLQLANVTDQTIAGGQWLLASY